MSSGDPLPSYEKADAHYSPVPRIYLGRRRPSRDNPTTPHQQTTTNDAEADGASARERPDLSSVSHSDPARELPASPCPSLTVPLSVDPASLPSWHPGNKPELYRRTPNGHFGTMPRSCLSASPIPPRLTQIHPVKSDNELAKAAARATTRKAVSGRCPEARSYQPYRPDGSDISTNKLASSRKEVRGLSAAVENEQIREASLEQSKDYYIQQRNQALEDKDRLERDLVQKREKLKQHYRDEISALREAHGAEVYEMKVKYEREVLNLQDDLNSQEDEYETQLERQKQDYEEELQSQERRYELKLQTQQEDYEGNLQSREAEYKRELQGVEKRTRAETANRIAQLENTVGTLKTKVAEQSSSMYYKPLADSHFKRSLGALAQKITNLATSVPRPSDYAAAKQIDATGFLSRSSQPRHWDQFVRHVTWQMMIQGFFQYPLGFGALGHEGEGQVELYQFYRLFANANPDGGFTLPNDTETNAGRAWFFGGILHDIRGSEVGDDAEKYRRLYWSNVRSAEARLLAMLQHMSGNRVEKRTKNQISTLVSDFGFLSLEIGSQRSHIMLEQCLHGEIAASSKFKDDDGDPNAAKVVVDIMTQPSMIRIGDGQGELNAEVVLSQGDVVAMDQGRRYQ